MADWNDLDAALLGADLIPREIVLRWIDTATDLSTLAKLYRLTGGGYYRIQPDLGAEASSGLIQRYLLECVRENVTVDVELEDGPEILDRWGATQVLHGWFCQLSERDEIEDRAILGSAAQAVTRLFLESGAEVRNAIEQGFLEHALEMAGLRPYFEHWSKDERLREAWDRALAWGEAHPGYTWGLLQQLRQLQKE